MEPRELYEKQIEIQNKMREIYYSGKTMKEIGVLFNLSTQRIQQILTHKYVIRESSSPSHGLKLDYKLCGRERTRELVRIRDKHTCQDCGKVWIEGNRRFDVHHLNGLCGKKSRGYDRIADMGGLITLCHKCHFNRPEHRCKRKVAEKLSTGTLVYLKGV